MNRSPLIRRVLVLVASAALATAASLAAATPASAHKSAITGTYVCDEATGDWIVTWTLRNEYKIDMVVTAVHVMPDGTTVTGVEAGATVAARSELTGAQTVGGDERQATLAVEVEWVNGKPGKALGDVRFKGSCEQPTTPPASPEPTPSPAPSPSETPAPGEGGGLPVTGSSVGAIVGAAAALLALGIGLFLTARRRRIRFTA